MAPAPLPNVPDYARSLLAPSVRRAIAWHSAFGVWRLAGGDCDKKELFWLKPHESNPFAMAIPGGMQMEIASSADAVEVADAGSRLQLWHFPQVHLEG